MYFRAVKCVCIYNLCVWFLFFFPESELKSTVLEAEKQHIDDVQQVQVRF